jgi:hypothetical protein
MDRHTTDLPSHNSDKSIGLNGTLRKKRGKQGIGQTSLGGTTTTILGVASAPTTPRGHCTTRKTTSSKGIAKLPAPDVHGEFPGGDSRRRSQHRQCSRDKEREDDDGRKTKQETTLCTNLGINSRL